MSLKSDTKGVFDFDLSASSYNYLQDIHAQSVHGRADRRRLFAERQDHAQRRHQLAERRRQGHLASVRRTTVRTRSASASTATATGSKIRSTLSSVWYATSSTGTGQLYSNGIGETRTGALWVQDAWKIVPNLKLTLGGRLETWRALDGFNLNHDPTANRRRRRYP